jgi:hypothetical protein
VSRIDTPTNAPGTPPRQHTQSGGNGSEQRGESSTGEKHDKPSGEHVDAANRGHAPAQRSARPDAHRDPSGGNADL